MANVHEMYGKVCEAHATLNEEYDRLLQVLAAVSLGEIPPGCVTVDLKTRSYSWDVKKGRTPPSSEATPSRLKVAKSK